MEYRYRVATTQLDALIAFLEEHPQLARGGIGFGGRSKEAIERKWEEVAAMLNAHEGGAIKDGAQWKKYWIDMKYRVKLRASLLRHDTTGTGGGAPRIATLSALDARILAILGPAAIVGDSEHQVPLFGTTASDARHAGDAVPADQRRATPDQPMASASSVERAPTSVATTPTGASSPGRRPTRHRLPSSPTRLANPRHHQGITNEWVRDLEARRVAAEQKLANAAETAAEASLVTAEATRVTAEATLINAEANRTMAEATLINGETNRSMAEAFVRQQELVAALAVELHRLIDLVLEH